MSRDQPRAKRRQNHDSHTGTGVDDTYSRCPIGGEPFGDQKYARHHADEGKAESTNQPKTDIQVPKLAYLAAQENTQCEGKTPSEHNFLYSITVEKISGNR